MTFVVTKELYKKYGAFFLSVKDILIVKDSSEIKRNKKKTR